MLHDFKLLTFPWIFLVIIELILYLITLFFAVKCAYIIIKVRTFHKNLSALAVVLILQWLEPVIAKMISWPYETGFWTLEGTTNKSFSNTTIKQWWTEDKSEMIQIIDFDDDFHFFVSGFLKLHYAISMSNILLVIAIERSLACYFLNDYEKKSRFWIAITIVLVDQSFNFIVSFIFYLNYVPFLFMIVITGTPNVLAISLLLYSRQYNLKVTRIHEKYAHQSNYSLAARFQAKENIKCFDMIGRVLIAGFCIVVLGFVVAIALFLNILPQLDTLWNLCILAVSSLPPIVICPAIIYSVDSFRNHPFLPIDYIYTKLKLGQRKISIVPRKRSSAKSEDIRKETETYFNQLAASWT